MKDDMQCIGWLSDGHTSPIPAKTYTADDTISM